MKNSKQAKDLALSPEARLLTLCAQTQPSPEAKSELERLLIHDLDWAWVRQQIIRHGIEPLVDRAWKPHSLHVPQDLAEEIKARAREVAFRNLQQLHELLRLVGLLEDKGIPVIPFKGPLLAVEAYGNVAYRRFVDLDIIVPREHVENVCVLLLEEGYRPAKEMSASAEAEYIDTGLGYEFVHRARQTVVEVHWTFFYEIYSFNLTPEEVWERHNWTAIAGQQVRTLATEDLLIYLCAHGSKHRWMKISWIADICELLSGDISVDWDSLYKRADRADSLRMVLVGLYLCQRLMRIDLPYDVTVLINKDQKVSKMANEAIDKWLFFDPEVDKTSELEIFLYHMQERERWTNRWPYIMHHLKLWLPLT